MCMYCERRQDVPFGWRQSSLPMNGNLISEEAKACVYDYQGSQPELIITDESLAKELWGSGIASTYIMINFCPACGRRLGKKNWLPVPKQNRPAYPAYMSGRAVLDRITHGESDRRSRDYCKMLHKNDSSVTIDHFPSCRQLRFRLMPIDMNAIKNLITWLPGSANKDYERDIQMYLMNTDSNMMAMLRGIVVLSDSSQWKSLLPLIGLREKPESVYLFRPHVDIYDPRRTGYVVIDYESICEAASECATGESFSQQLYEETKHRLFFEALLTSVRWLGLSNPFLPEEDYPEGLQEPQEMHSWACKQYACFTHPWQEKQTESEV